MSSPSKIVCRPTKWFLWRAALMLVMFGGFGLYFLYDWKIGYPEKNLIVAHYEAFSDAGEAWANEENRGTPEQWEQFVDSRTIPFEDDPTMYPADTDFDKRWPDILKKMDDPRTDELWREFSKEKGWPQKIDPKEDVKSGRKIGQQIIAAGVCFVLTGVTLFFLLRTKRRSMEVDEQGFYPPGGDLIPFEAMKTIDKRKWETKGLATITYERDGKEQKAKVDGMVYGQFKEEDGAPAEALFQKILENFQGELIEFVGEDDEEDDGDSNAEQGDEKKPARSDQE